MRKVLVSLLTSLLFVLICNNYSVKANDSVILNIGDTYQIEYTGSYGSTNSKIATVDENGIITALTMGQCNIVVINDYTAQVIDLTVVYEESLYIDEDGLDYQNPIIYIDDVKVELNKTNVKDLYMDLLNTKKYSIKLDEYVRNLSIMSRLDQIFDNTLTLYIYERSTDIVRYKVYIRPTENVIYEKTPLKDMIVVGINPTYQDYKINNNKDSYVIDDYYWFNKSFSIQTTPKFLDFYDYIYTKFSGYTKENIMIDYTGSDWQVAIKLKNMPESYYDGYRKVSVNDRHTYYMVLHYKYNVLEDACKAIGCYITSNVTKKFGIGAGYPSYSMY